MEKVIINEDIIKGSPSRILSCLEVDLANNLLKGVNDDIILKMKQLIDVFETLYDRINDDYISFKWNNMGSWYLDYFDIYSKEIIQDGLSRLENDSNNADVSIYSYYEKYTKETGNNMDFLEFRDLLIPELESDDRILQVENGLDDDMLSIVFKGGVKYGKD